MCEKRSRAPTQFNCFCAESAFEHCTVALQSLSDYERQLRAALGASLPTLQAASAALSRSIIKFRLQQRLLLAATCCCSHLQGGDKALPAALSIFRGSSCSASPHKEALVLKSPTYSLYSTPRMRVWVPKVPTSYMQCLYWVLVVACSKQ